MRISPNVMMGILYFGLAAVFVYFAVASVNASSWTFWTYLFAGLAAIDIMVGIRFFRSKSKNSTKK
ncbi:membrane protein implicated in regulation of membrane protease activity [Salibacterium salarium]|uniref:YdiK family protein n=1 Tax=Salibacterium salarium TaxID=284579 RepID=UPI002783C642|nr:YdiK family protein [Salibacterium salarium]MDQ0300424.1 membrane protein implicated in regulation of membrane protease activity [Salibacterium salarium]